MSHFYALSRERGMDHEFRIDEGKAPVAKLTVTGAPGKRHWQIIWVDRKSIVGGYAVYKTEGGGYLLYRGQPPKGKAAPPKPYASLVCTSLNSDPVTLYIGKHRYDLVRQSMPESHNEHPAKEPKSSLPGIKGLPPANLPKVDGLPPSNLPSIDHL